MTSDAAHPCKNSEGKVRLEAAKGDTLRRDRVRCDIGVGGLPVVGTASDGWCTLGNWRNIGDDCIAGAGRQEAVSDWPERHGLLPEV